MIHTYDFQTHADVSSKSVYSPQQPLSSIRPLRRRSYLQVASPCALLTAVPSNPSVTAHPVDGLLCHSPPGPQPRRCETVLERSRAGPECGRRPRDAPALIRRPPRPEALAAEHNELSHVV